MTSRVGSESALSTSQNWMVLLRGLSQSLSFAILWIKLIKLSQQAKCVVDIIIKTNETCVKIGPAWIRSTPAPAPN